MSPDEYRKIIDIAAKADGGCSCCVESLWQEIAEVFPDIPLEAFAAAPKKSYWEPLKMAESVWDELGRKR